MAAPYRFCRLGPGYTYTECSQGRRRRGGGVLGPDENPPAGAGRHTDAVSVEVDADRPAASDNHHRPARQG